MRMAHTHAHEPGGHPHGHAHGTGERSLGLVALLTGGFMLAEVAGGLASGSLALLADAGHMLTDFASLTLAWIAARLARRPASWRHTYGFDRVSILVAFVNALALFVIAGWIVVEAWGRLRAPSEVLGGLMLWVAVAGLVVNVVGYRLLHGHAEGNLNVRAAALHVAGDLLGSVAAIAAALVIMATGWTPIDPILSVVVALIILRSAWSVARQSGHILLEGAPAHIDTREVARSLAATLPEVVEVHHVHVWSISQERAMITLHARVKSDEPPERVVARIKAHLREAFAIVHATVEIERDGCADERTTCARES